MDLVYTDAKRVDLGVLSAYTFDLSYGAGENDFQMEVGITDTMLEFGAFIYIEGTEYGGIVDTKKVTSYANKVTYTGRTWHGLMNSKVIQPDTGEDYLIVSGEANKILSTMIERLGLSGLFKVVEYSSGVNISGYRFHRYCKGYDGIKAMLADNEAKLKIFWQNRSVYLSAEPIVDYTKTPVDGEGVITKVEKHGKKVNHLVCLGRGELSDREVVHLYADQNGNISETQYFTGLDEVSEVYDNSNSEDLRSDGIKKFKELRENDKAELDITENESSRYDIGDIVGAIEVVTGISVSSAVTQKTVNIDNGVVSTEYKTGG